MSPFPDVLRQARVMVFDFDGTLVDSNPIKQRAFELCFSEFPEQREEILAYCWDHHQTPRGDKFQHVYERILGLPYTAAAAAALHERFERATTGQIIAADEVPGASWFLRRAGATRRIAVLSSTPQEVLVEILTARGWLASVHLVQGAPVDKTDWLRRFQRSYGPNPHAVLVFGDTVEDAEAAAGAGCVFIWVGKGRDAGGGALHVTDFLEFLTDAADRDAISART